MFTGCFNFFPLSINEIRRMRFRGVVYFTCGWGQEELVFWCGDGLGGHGNTCNIGQGASQMLAAGRGL